MTGGGNKNQPVRGKLARAIAKHLYIEEQLKDAVALGPTKHDIEVELERLRSANIKAAVAETDEAPPLRQREQAVLRILSEHGPELLTSTEIAQHSESGKHGEAMAERTSAQAAKALVDADLAERPLGLKEGLRLTKAGRARAKNLPAVRK